MHDANELVTILQQDRNVWRFLLNVPGTRDRFKLHAR